LYEEDCSLQVESAGEEIYEHGEGITPKVRRFIGYCHSVKVDYAKNAWMRVLKRNPVGDSAKIISKVHLTRRLDARKYAGKVLRRHDSFSPWRRRDYNGNRVASQPYRIPRSVDEPSRMVFKPGGDLVTGK
jgi:hypothetical protein